VSGGVKCWGYNADGELDDGSQAERHVPVPAGGLTTNVVAIAAGRFHNCALINGGTVRCWGRNPNGQLGDGTLNATNANPSVAVSGIASGATAIATGDYFSCAVVSGAAKCWGSNYLGELGDGTLAEHYTPMSVTGLGSGVSDRRRKLHRMRTGQYRRCKPGAVLGRQYRR
jgi:alpha-tubulin suppressor-like RCC1 family protein